MGHGRGSYAGALGAAALVVLLAACGTDGGDEGTGETSESTSAIDPALLECGEATDAEPVWQLVDADLSAATWSMPPGFVETFAYSEDRAVEHIETFWAAEPEEDPIALNVLTVVVYTEIDWGEAIDECGRVPTTTVDDRVVGYNQTNGAEALTELTAVEVGGLPALTQDVGLEEYSYRGYWVFGRSQMVHLYCQWTSDAEKDRILTGCEDLLGSVEVPGA